MNSMLRRTFAVGFLGISLAAAAPAAVLYDASGLAMPHQAPWGWTLGGAGATVTAPSAGSPFTRLDSTAAMAAQHGWTRLAPFALDNVAGYDVTFDLRVDQESHANNDRAGVSVIVLGSDKRGIELSFWTNEVWAQNDSPLFTHGEGAAFDTTAAGSGIGGLRRYRLHVSGGNYTLFAEGSALFGGALRDYTAFAGFPDPYETPNLLWVGDDTTSAGASADFSYFETTAVPEPSTLAMLGIGAIWLRRRRARG